MIDAYIICFFVIDCVLNEQTATDIGVIVEWWNYEKNIDNVNTSLLAYTSLAILIFYRLISSIYFFIKERSIKIAVFQFLDILVYREVLYSHQKFQRKLKQPKNDDDRENSIRTASISISGFGASIIAFNAPKTNNDNSSNNNVNAPEQQQQAAMSVELHTLEKEKTTEANPSICSLYVFVWVWVRVCVCVCVCLRVPVCVFGAWLK